MVEVAIIGRTHKDSEGYTSPLPLLDDALAILEPLTNLPLRHSPPSFLSRVHEQLAVTQLWKAICIQEELVKYVSLCRLWNAHSCILAIEDSAVQCFQLFSPNTYTHISSNSVLAACV